MELRVTRTAFIEAMSNQRGYKKDYDEFDSWRDGNKATEAEVNGIKLVFPFCLKI